MPTYHQRARFRRRNGATARSWEWVWPGLVRAGLRSGHCRVQTPTPPSACPPLSPRPLPHPKEDGGRSARSSAGNPPPQAKPTSRSRRRRWSSRWFILLPRSVRKSWRLRTKSNDGLPKWSSASLGASPLSSLSLHCGYGTWTYFSSPSLIFMYSSDSQISVWTYIRNGMGLTSPPLAIGSLTPSHLLCLTNSAPVLIVHCMTHSLAPSVTSVERQPHSSLCVPTRATSVIIQHGHKYIRAVLQYNE